jgi:PAS domain S-box-containing protein
MHLLNTGPEPFFEDVVDHMAAICRAPVAIVFLSGSGRVWLNGLDGARGAEMDGGAPPRAPGLFGRSHAVIDNVASLEHAANFDLHTIRAYVTAPLVIDGEDVGNLCIADTRPRRWGEFEINYMQRSARLVAGHFEARAALAERDRRMELERQLAAAGALHETVIGSLHEGLVVQDATGRFIACNPAGLAILGLTEDQLYGRTSMDPHWRVVDEAGETITGDRHPQMVALATGKPQLGQVFGVERPDGERRWVEANAVPMATAAGQKPVRVVTTFNDITERREQEARLAEALRKAEQAAVSKQQFLANMSHEIRTPLNGILGMAQVLTGTDLSPAQHEFVTTILESGQTLTALLNDVLDLSKIEAGKFDIVRNDHSLRDLLSLQVRLWSPRAEEKGIKLALSIENGLAAPMSFDKVRVQQCVANLVSNAVKFTQTGGVTVSASSRALPDGESLIEIAVSDTGCGMDEDALGRLFQPFAQADETISRAHGGTGLGLSIVRRLAELMGGTASATSEPSRGSVFRVTFRAAAASASVPAPAPAVQQAGLRTQSAGSLRVLLVDDHPINRQIATLFLEPYCARVATAVNGEEALIALEVEDFDLVLLDMHMPVLDGTATLARIRASGRKWAELPVIALTADALTGDRERFLAKGWSGYLPKPLAERDLLSEIGRVRPGALAAA